jgi:hypothetical protein
LKRNQSCSRLVLGLALLAASGCGSVAAICLLRESSHSGQGGIIIVGLFASCAVFVGRALRRPGIESRIRPRASLATIAIVCLCEVGIAFTIASVFNF